jgi:hypothetical protein
MAERVGFELVLILKGFVTYKSLTKVSSPYFKIRHTHDRTRPAM